MTKQEVLRKAAADVKSGKVYYNWYRMGSCNCGIVAQTCTGLGDYAVSESVFGLSGIWGEMSKDQEVCSQTGIPLNKVFKSLVDCGFSFKDIVDLEHMENEIILERAGLEDIDNPFDKKENFIKYCRAWANLIKEGKLK
jgi:hypothetical protein